MEQNLFSGAINLTIFGMGFVFIFLTILVFVTKFMSFVINKNNDSENSNNSSHSNNSRTNKETIDEETKFVIQQAIKMHTSA